MAIAPAKHRAYGSAPAAAAIAPRPTAHQRGYTRDWNKYSKWRLKRHPLCARCPELAVLTDHITPHAGPSDPLFWDETNHQSLCKSCHDRKTATEDAGFGRRRNDRIVICGPPGSGKTSWARKQARPGDLIWDMDDVADCLFGLPKYPRPDEHARLLRELRDWLLNRITSRPFSGRLFIILADQIGAAELAKHINGRLVRAHHEPLPIPDEAFTCV